MAGSREGAIAATTAVATCQLKLINSSSTCSHPNEMGGAPPVRVSLPRHNAITFGVVCVKTKDTSGAAEAGVS